MLRRDRSSIPEEVKAEVAGSSRIEACSYPSLHSADINESFHLINLEAERFNADVLSCMMTGIIKQGKKSSHTRSIDSSCEK